MSLPNMNPLAANSCELESERAHIYALLSALLASPANHSLIEIISNCNINQDTWKVLQKKFNKADLALLDDEYHRLFIGVSVGELLPYRSHYISGCLMGKPLLELRQDIQAMGLDTQAEQKDPEDHISGIFEIMRLLITDLALPFHQQKIFFKKHIMTWVDDFLTDLSAVKNSHYYRLVAYFGQWFMQVEKRYFGYL